VEETSAFLTAVSPGEMCLQLRSQMPDTTAYQLGGEPVTGDQRRLPLVGRGECHVSMQAVNALGQMGQATAFTIRPTRAPWPMLCDA
jgi:hypothetical protein